MAKMVRFGAAQIILNAGKPDFNSAKKVRSANNSVIAVSNTHQQPSAADMAELNSLLAADYEARLTADMQN